MRKRQRDLVEGGDSARSCGFDSRAAHMLRPELAMLQKRECRYSLEVP